MIPILFIIPKFSLNVFLSLLGISAMLYLIVFFLFRKRVDSVKNFRNDLFGYFIFAGILITLLFLFGPFPVRTYGVAVASGFLSAIIVSRSICKKNDIDPDIIFDLAVYILVGTIIGARFFYIIFYDWSYFISNPLRMFKIWEGGLVFYGGLIGGISAGLYYVKKKKLPVLKLADIMGTVIPLGLFFGRLGCYGYGCCYGAVAPEWFPFKIKFPAIANKLIGFTPAYENHLFHGLVTEADKFSLGVYPTQIISSLAGLLLFFLLYFLFKKRKYDGQIAGFTLIFYAVIRFLIELLRVEPRFLTLSVSQWISIVMFACGLYILKYSKKTALK